VSVYLCHEEPDLYDFETEVVGARPGAVLLARSSLHPGGGGQVSDVGKLEHSKGIATIIGISTEDGRPWHILDDPAPIWCGPVTVHVDREHRFRVAQLHTDTHLLNALIFDRYSGALVTGAQINADGTARMDFDLPDVDNAELRALEPALNDLIREGFEVNALYVAACEAATTPGLIRSLSVAPPPTPSGMLRVIDIVGVDRQACGGTHLTDTAQSAAVQIIKVENKGRRNRRIRLRLKPVGR
jgi:misacylated tRNA(Ala) deacylase